MSIQSMFVDVSDPKFKDAMSSLLKQAVSEAVAQLKSDPLNAYGDTMRRNEVAEVLSMTPSQVRNREISEAELKTSGRKPDYSKQIVVYKDGGNPYYLTSQIREYRDRLLKVGD